MNDFFQQVYRVVERVPFGRVVSYGQIARMLGQFNASRAVGWAMRCCPDEIPAHRVVKADGTITGGAFAVIRRERLEAEGVSFLPDGRVDMASCRWQGDDDLDGIL